jgi:hypothetical protein
VEYKQHRYIIAVIPVKSAEEERQVVAAFTPETIYTRRHVTYPVDAMTNPTDLVRHHVATGYEYIRDNLYKNDIMDTLMKTAFINQPLQRFEGELSQ